MGERSRRRVALAVAVLVAWMSGAGVLAQQAVTPALDPETISKTVEAVAAVIEREYFDPDLATRMAQSLRTRSSQGHYAAARTWGALAQALTRDVFPLSHDKHLDVRVAPDRSAPAASPAETRETRARRANYGVQRIEVLGGNVGYLNLTSFYRPEEAVDTLSAAMRLLRSADALIVDMRENGGGSPETVAWLLSHFFDTADLPLFEIVPRTGAAQHYATAREPIAERNHTRPTFVLTARGTFSAGEGFPFVLQERRRAVIVGEPTAGAANPGRPYPAGDHLEVTVPNGQVRTAVTRSNWEGRGVTPDVPVPASDALRVAHIQALRALLKATADGLWRETLQRQLTLAERPPDKR